MLIICIVLYYIFQKINKLANKFKYFNLDFTHYINNNEINTKRMIIENSHYIEKKILKNLNKDNDNNNSISNFQNNNLNTINKYNENNNLKTNDYNEQKEIIQYQLHETNIEENERIRK